MQVKIDSSSNDCHTIDLNGREESEDDFLFCPIASLSIGCGSVSVDLYVVASVATIILL